MPRKIVLMVVLPGNVKRGTNHISDLDYVPFALPSWRWWCARNDIEFVLADRPVGGRLADAPAPIQRWEIAAQLLAEQEPATQLAVVDADTMVSWKAPDFFDLAAGEFSAVADVWDPRWINRSIATYQRFFPDVHLDWWDYFNSGLIVLTREQRPLFEAVVEMYAAHKGEMDAIHREVDVGIDQTILNFATRQRGVRRRVLPRAFNHVGCFEVPPSMRHTLTSAKNPDDLGFLESIGAFDFIKYSHVWHFTSVVSRPTIMKATWERVRHHYDAVERLEDEASKLPGRSPLVTGPAVGTPDV